MGQIELFNISNISLVILISISLYTDLTSNKIKNKMIYSFCAFGLILNTIQAGVKGGLSSLYGLILPILILFILYLMGAMGAGDIKLFAAVGAIMGSDFVVKTIGAAFLSGGIIALILMIFRKNGRERLKYLVKYILLVVMSRQFLVYSDIKSNRSAKFPFAIAIFVGVLTTALLQ